MSSEDTFTQKRERMVKEQLESRGIHDQRVLNAFRTVPREEFVPPRHRSSAYDDRALPTKEGQTISQPYMVASMTETLGVSPGDWILEVGTGSGYQAAILAEMEAEVYTIEHFSSLLSEATERFQKLGYASKIHTKVGDGTTGWEEHAPYDGIIVTAAAPEVPPSLKRQTAVGGTIVIPIGSRTQQKISILERTSRDGWSQEKSTPCVFVSLVGEEGWDHGRND